ncbi:DUF1758 domain-containing protein [Trichonephila clavipes]|nr:DUF1758 domain-containing protein [Trichonephila clavipes]
MSKETLVVSNRKRGAIKAQLTRIKDFMNNPDEKDKTHLESKLDTLKSFRIKLSDIRNKYYEVVADDSDLEPLESEILDLEDDCEDIQIRIKNILSNIDLKNNAVTSCDNSFKNIKLPDINSNSHFSEILSLEKFTHETAKNLRTFIDCCQKHLRGLKIVGLDLNEFSKVLLINLILRKLDKETRKNYELNFASTELPKWEDFMNFLLKRCLILENIQANNATAIPSERSYKTKSFLAKLYPANCVICKQPHPVFRSKKFNDLSVNERFNSVKRNNLCIKCFSCSHKVALRKSSRNCPNCSKRHNSLLCRNFERNVDSQRSPVYRQNSRGEDFPLPALLDSGSQSNLITHEAALALGLKCERVNTTICSVNGTSQFIKNKVSTVVSSKNRQFQKLIEFLVVPKITSLTPTNKLDISGIKIPEYIKLSDENFYSSGRIDLLLSNQIFFEILNNGKIKLADRKLILIKRFWEIENCPDFEIPTMSREEKLCEEHFTRTYNRDETGRFIVKMPMSKDPSCLGDSKQTALQMGHMEEVEDEDSAIVYYLPHHGVYRHESKITPSRVVFNASSITTSGESLNSIQLNGGVIQRDLFSILLELANLR